MGKINVFAAFIFLIQTAPALATPGFYSPADPRVPSAVRDHKVSIFQMHVPIGEPESLTVKTSDEYDIFINQMSGVPFVSDQISYCKETGLKTCHFFLQTGTCTAFLTDDGKSLWTAWHCFESYVQILRKDMAPDLSENDLVKAFSKVPVFFNLVNSDGLEVFASKKLMDASFGALPVESETFSEATTVQKAVTDGVEIRLSKAVGKGLHFSTAAALPGDSIYIEGFPALTKDRMKRFNVADSDGKSLYVTMGKTISSKDGFKILGHDLPDDLLAYLGEFQFYSDADGMQRMSGSPVMNSKGDVVGIFTSIAESSDHPPLTNGISINMINLLKDRFSAGAVK